MNGKGSMARPRSVSGDEYRNNFDRIFAKQNADTRKWGFAQHKDDEVWMGGDLDTREDAIAEARDHFGEEADDGFAICRCTVIDPRDTLPDPDDILQMMSESAGDTWGWVEEYPEIEDGGVEALKKLLEDWATKYVSRGFWMADDIEVIPARQANITPEQALEPEAGNGLPPAPTFACLPTPALIRALRAEAGAAGDEAQVRICDRALDGDVDAIRECGDVIAEAATEGTSQAAKWLIAHPKK